MASYSHIITLPNTLSSTPFADICQGLTKPIGEKNLPTILLYDERGLRLYDDITTKAPEYYLFAAEEQILRDSGSDIVRLMHGGSLVRNGEVVLELGAGALRKTSLLLKALAQASPLSHPPAVTYLALDLEKRELDRTLSLIASSDLGPELTNRVRIGGLCGTYDDGIAYVRGGGLNDVHSSPSLTASSLHTAIEPKLADDINALVNLPATSEKAPDDESPFSLDISTDSTALDPSSDADGASSPLTSTDSQSTYSTDYEDTPPLHFLFLGSSIGNFTREGAAAFLKSLPLRPWTSDPDAASGGAIGDTLLLGLDHDNDPKLIEIAYNDPAGHTRSFIMNGLAGVRRELRQAGMPEASITAFCEENWEYQEYYNTVDNRHEGRYLSKIRQTVMVGSEKVEFEEGETIHVEHSYKYSESAAQKLFDEANLKPVHRWTSSNGLYSVWLLHRPAFCFPIAPSIVEVTTKAVDKDIPIALPMLESPKFPTIPTLDEWANMWKLWDAVTLGMIPESMLMLAPIDLRHKCLFYLGHIPTFLDIHLSRLLGEPHTEPDNFKYIFERGIDPHVDDPTQCHPHSKVPERDEEWPLLETILAFRDRVRTRLRFVHERLLSGELASAGISPRKAQRILWMTYEHEAFHVETLLYMLIQKAGEEDGTRPPPGIPPPDWETLQVQWSCRKDMERGQETRLTLGPCSVSLGHNDPETEDYKSQSQMYKEGHEFGWDNEHPKRTVEVKKFTIERKPISNGEYHQFWSTKAGTKPPASWIVKGSDVLVRTLYGPVPLSIAKDWPLIASYDELNAHALSKGGRIPTHAELRLFMDDQASRGIVYGHNNAGWGYQRWWFEPPSLGNPGRNEAPHNGGIWELTSTIMDKYDGYQPSTLYPGYSSDFFDGRHYVVIGGSFATVPRLAQRRSLVNYYQHNYPYAWTGARIAYDA